MSTSLAAALLESLDDVALDALAERLAPRLTGRMTDNRPNAWLTVESAAEHLSCPKSRIYALTSARRIPHHRDGSRVLFDRDELDVWVRGGGATRP
jgi:excisionase family DNA binding protein